LVPHHHNKRPILNRRLHIYLQPDFWLLLDCLLLLIIRRLLYHPLLPLLNIHRIILQLNHFIRGNDLHVVGLRRVYFGEEFLGRRESLLGFGEFLLGALDDSLDELFGLGEVVVFEWNGQADGVALVG
jgi:hypothetical protein